MMGNTYIISDLHGNYKIFKALLEKINFSNKDHLYIIGDICDRGPDSLNIYLEIRNYINITLLKGNHEYMAQEALKKAIEFHDFDYPSQELKLWSINGGYATIDNIRKYLNKNKLLHKDYQIVRDSFLKTLYTYFKQLPLYKELTVNNHKYILVHAGVDPEDFQMDHQCEDMMLWVRDYFHFSPCDLNVTYIFGHTPTTFLNDDHSFDIWIDPIYHNKIGIDGGLAMPSGGQLNCLCLETMEVIVLKQDDYK